MWRQRWQTWQDCRPRLHRDGLSLPGKLVLGQLQQWLNQDWLSIDDLLLDEHGAVLWLTVQQPVPTTLQLHCQPATAGPDNALHLHYQLKGDPSQSGLRGHALAKLASLAGNSDLAATLVQKLLADLPWVSISSQHITIYWRDITALQQWLHTMPMVRKALNQFDIDTVSTHHDSLRLRLKRRRPANQG